MKDWQKSFFGGVVVGSFGVVPLLFWLAEIRLAFRCPNCDKQITVWKQSKQAIPQLKSDSEKNNPQTADERSEESDLSIATAPTV